MSEDYKHNIYLVYTIKANCNITLKLSVAIARALCDRYAFLCVCDDHAWMKVNGYGEWKRHSKSIFCKHFLY